MMRTFASGGIVSTCHQSVAQAAQKITFSSGLWPEDTGLIVWKEPPQEHIIIFRLVLHCLLSFEILLTSSR